MTLLPLIALAIQQCSYFDANFAARTGSNGYEEYLLAADLLQETVLKLDLTEFMNTNLAKSRSMIVKYSRVLQLLRSGNAKTRVPPWTEADTEDSKRYPWVELILSSDLMAASSLVRFADGQPRLAVDELFELVTYSQRGGESLILEELVGSSYDRGCVYDVLKSGIHRLSLTDCKRLREYFESTAKREPAVIRIARDLLPHHLSEVPKIFRRIEELQDWGEVPPQMRALDSSQKEHYIDKIREGLVQYQRQIDDMYAEGEANWRDLKFSDNDPIVEFAVNYLNPFIMWDFAVEGRTRLRLAGLHCRVIEYKRMHNRLPTSIDEIGPKEITMDPLNGARFAYEKLSEQSYRLYSRGSAASGPISLGWEVLD